MLELRADMIKARPSWAAELTRRSNEGDGSSMVTDEDGEVWVVVAQTDARCIWAREVEAGEEGDLFVVSRGDLQYSLSARIRAEARAAGWVEIEDSYCNNLVLQMPFVSRIEAEEA